MGFFSRRDKDGYDKKGYDEYGYDKDGYDKKGYDKKGYDKDGYDRHGFELNGIHKITGTLFNKDGFNVEGFDKDGFDKGGRNNRGFDKAGYDKYGFDWDGFHKITRVRFNEGGFDRLGFDKDGFNRLGFDKDGFKKTGIHKITGRRYDEGGYNKGGYDKYGFDKDGYDRTGFDTNRCDRRGCSKEDYQSSSANFDFSKITSSFNSDLDAVLVIAYDKPTKIKSKLFFSHDDKTGIYSREFDSFSNNNTLHFHIEKAGKGFSTTWNYEGDGEIGDNFESGYTLIINIEHANQTLRTLLIKKLGKMNFGCIPSLHTLHCHKNEYYPTNEKAKKLLQKVVELFNSENDVES